jgi:retinol dehydrogenase-11
LLAGIGYGIALDFAKRGAKVILACRNPDRAEEARLKIIKESGNDNVVVTLLDLSSFKSVDNFVKTVTECEERLDILVNNAAIIEFDGCRLSKDGYVLIRQVNYFSVFLLTLGLIGLKVFLSRKIIHSFFHNGRFNEKKRVESHRESVVDDGKVCLQL